MQDKKECYITKSTSSLHKHHIFNGANRSKSEKYGCWIWLRSDWHNLASYGIHFDKKLDLEIKKQCQSKFESIYGHEMFMDLFHKNYL